MKRRTKIISVAAIAGVTLAALTAGAYARYGGGWNGAGHFSKAVNRMEEVFDKHDLDKNGSVTEAEIQKLREQELAKYDVDKNGTLSLPEFQQWTFDYLKPTLAHGFQFVDDDASGEITLSEFAAPFSKMLSRHDVNNDGALTKEEIVNSARQRHKGKRWHSSYNGQMQGWRQGQGQGMGPGQGQGMNQGMGPGMGQGMGMGPGQGQGPGMGPTGQGRGPGARAQQGATSN